MVKKLFSTFLPLIAASCAFTLDAAAQVDPNFHIYLCFGQSNMEGNAQIENIDRTNVPERFQMMAAVNFNNPKREMKKWYTAVPPLARQGTGLTPADWFGRTMVANLPENVKVGVVMVAIGGAKIEHLAKDFDPSALATEADWYKNYFAQYDNRPYDRLVECAKEAQKAGVIKGILLHQGESNTGDRTWPAKVNKIYTDLLTDLGLKAEDVPLFAGEVVTSDKGGACGGMNPIIDGLPETIATAHVVSAAGLEQKGDGLHFTAQAYRQLGCRYATEVLNLMGIKDPVTEIPDEKPVVVTPNPGEGDFVFDLATFNPAIWESGTFDTATSTFVAGQYGFGGWEYSTPIDLSGYKYLVAELGNPQGAWDCKFRVFDTASYWEEPYSVDYNNNTLIVLELDGLVKTLDSGVVPLNTKKIYRVGFWSIGGKSIIIKQVFATNNNPYEASAAVPQITGSGHNSFSVYALNGALIKAKCPKEEIDRLPRGLYIVNGRKYVVK